MISKAAPAPFRVVAIHKIKRVTTLRRNGTQVIQNHRGFTPVIYFRGQREPVRTNSFHQKRKSAIETGEWYARKVLREQAATTEEQS